MKGEHDEAILAALPDYRLDCEQLISFKVKYDQSHEYVVDFNIAGKRDIAQPVQTRTQDSAAFRFCITYKAGSTAAVS